jgi:hypothetical protein
VSVDFDAIAVALAVRFGPTVVSAPSGETNVVQSTAALPDAITDEPTVLVFPPSSIQFSYGPSIRKGVAFYPVRFYIYKVRDTSRNSTLLNDWISALYAQLDGQVHLGLSSYVDYGVVDEIMVGPLTYAGIEYHGLEFTVRVPFQEGLSLTAGA